MTKRERRWLASESPRVVFKSIKAPSDRKLLLFCIHGCFFDRGERDIDAATSPYADLWRLTERFADGRADEAEMRSAWVRYGGAEGTGPFRPREWAVMWMTEGFGADLKALIIDLLREIFGNPFRPVAREPSWLTTDVLAIARGIYDERAFDRMPILADALQDAGCDNEDVLNHCRDAKQLHVRGCWVLDLVLGNG